MSLYKQESAVKNAPDNLLLAVMQGRSDDFPQWMAMAELTRRREINVAGKGAEAKQQLAQGKVSVKDRMLSRMLPEELGIGMLPAENMQAMAAADGGIVGYADGGEVARYNGEDGSMVEYEDPVTGEKYMKPVGGLAQKWLAFWPSWGAQNPDVQRQRKEYGLPTYDELQAAKKKAPADVAPAAKGPSKKGEDDTNAPVLTGKKAGAVGAPAAAPSPTGISYNDLMKFYENRQSAYAPYMEKMTAMLEDQQKKIAEARQDAKGIAALRMAQGFAAPGRAKGLFGLTGLSEALGGAAEEGQRAITAQQAGEQALASQKLQSEQLRAAADKADMQQALEWQKLKEEAGYHQGYLGVLGQKIGASAGAGGTRDISAALNNIKASIKAINEDRTMSPAAKQIKLSELYQAQNQLLSQSLGRVGITAGGGAAPKGAIQYER